MIKADTELGVVRARAPAFDGREDGGREEEGRQGGDGFHVGSGLLLE
jgi:hypothetical protein